MRELENTIERAVLIAKGTEITVADLPEPIREESASAEFVIPPNRTLADIERMTILQALEHAHWNKQEAARALGLYRPTLYSKMKKYQIHRTGRPTMGSTTFVTALPRSRQRHASHTERRG